MKIIFGAIYTCEGEKVTQKRLWVESLPNFLFLMFNLLDIDSVIEVTTEKLRCFDVGKSVASSSCQSIRHFRTDDKNRAQLTFTKTYETVTRDRGQN